MKRWVLIYLLSLEVFADFTTLSIRKVQDKIAQGVVIIDVLQQNEVDKYGIIPGTHKLTFFDNKGNYNTQKWLVNLSSIVKTKSTAIYFGLRSRYW